MSEREIFMNNGSYLICKVMDMTDDFMLCFHESKGEFVASWRMGTWAEMDSIQIYNKLKQKGN